MSFTSEEAERYQEMLTFVSASSVQSDEQASWEGDQISSELPNHNRSYPPSYASDDNANVNYDRSAPHPSFPSRPPSYREVVRQAPRADTTSHPLPAQSSSQPPPPPPLRQRPFLPSFPSDVRSRIRRRPVIPISDDTDPLSSSQDSPSGDVRSSAALSRDDRIRRIESLLTRVEDEYASLRSEGSADFTEFDRQEFPRAYQYISRRRQDQSNEQGVSGYMAGREDVLRWVRDTNDRRD